MPGLPLINNLGDAESATSTPWAVYCSQNCEGVEPAHPRIIFLTEAAYDLQMSLPDSLWSCPRCGGRASWSDENYERFYE